MARLFVDVTPLRESRNFRLLFTGHLASMLGNQLTVVAIAYQVYQLTHSSLWVGLVSLFQLPFLIWGSLWGGALGDRTDKRRILAIGGALLALLSCGLAVNSMLVRPSLAAIVLLSAAAAFGSIDDFDYIVHPALPESSTAWRRLAGETCAGEAKPCPNLAPQSGGAPACAWRRGALLFYL